MPHNENRPRMRTDQCGPVTLMHRQKPGPDRAGVSLSLAHYRVETECLSTWSKTDLKKLVGTVEKMRTMDANELRASSLCSPHRLQPLAERFVMPLEIGKDYRMHEIRVDRHNAARMHGVFEGNVFYLVWLDRKHKVFPS